VIAAFVLGVGAAAAGALCAAADGALLARAETEETGEEQPPASSDRERTHRALSAARLAAHLSSGAFFALALRLDLRPTLSALLLVLVIATLLALFAEIVPRAVGEALGAKILQPLEPLVRGAQFAFAPLVRGGAWVDAVLVRLFPPATPEDADREMIAERFRLVAEPGIAAAPRRSMVNRVFSLAETEVGDVMVPRVDIIGIEKDAPWSEMLDRVRSAEHARLPVYDGTLDEIIGIVYAKDLLPSVIADEPLPNGWLALARPASFIPETKSCDEQLRDFKTTRTHIAIVVDEFGGTAGLLTIEDLLEEIVGDIRDEYDIEEPPIVVEEGTRFWVAGRVTLDELSEALGRRFEHEEVSTVGGLIYEVLGRVPRAGEQLTLSGFRVVVERVRRRRIERVYFERQDSLAESSA
jgi:putative hemolysin